MPKSRGLSEYDLSWSMISVVPFHSYQSHLFWCTRCDHYHRLIDDLLPHYRFDLYLVAPISWSWTYYCTRTVLLACDSEVTFLVVYIHYLVLTCPSGIKSGIVLLFRRIT